MNAYISDIWQTIELQLTTIAPEIIATLNPGATATDIEKLEQALGKELPVDFKNYLLIHNGQHDPSRLKFFCEEGNLLSSDEIVATWVVLNEINDNLEPGLAEWWNHNYLPFADHNGNIACIDLRNGEIVIHVHNSTTERGIAQDFCSWFYEKLRVLEERRFTRKGYMNYFEFW